MSVASSLNEQYIIYCNVLFVSDGAGMLGRILFAWFKGYEVIFTLCSILLSFALVLV